MKTRASELRAFAKAMAFISPWLIGFAAFTALPIALSLYYSFCSFNLLQQPALPTGTENYRYLWSDDIFWKTLRNTLVYAATALPLGMVAALGVAMLLNRPIRGVTIYRAIVFLPSLVPVVASAMVWMIIFNPKQGILNSALMWLGMTDPPGWLTDIKWAMPAIVMMSFWGIGNTVVINLAALQDVPRELYEAADIDGASSFRKTWHVTLPAISPVIFFNLVMAIIGSLQIFAAPLILTGGGPDRSTYFYTQYIYDNTFQYVKLGYASSLAWVQLVIIIVLTLIAFWSSKHWVHYSGK